MLKVLWCLAPKESTDRLCTPSLCSARSRLWDIMELPVTKCGNRYVIVFRVFLTKWPFMFPAPDLKVIRIARLLADEIVPMFGVPESLLSDHGTNLLAHVMLDTCRLLGITKLNTTAYHPQCDGMVERLNRTLKAMLRKHAANLDANRTSTCPVYSGHIETLHMRQPGRSPHSCCSVSIVGHPPRPHYYHQVL